LSNAWEERAIAFLFCFVLSENASVRYLANTPSRLYRQSLSLLKSRLKLQQAANALLVSTSPDTPQSGHYYYRVESPAISETPPVLDIAPKAESGSTPPTASTYLQSG
jgi:hypothetical protein